jgi:hypothetical protein
VPFALAIGLFLLLAALNWGYASKFFQPSGTDKESAYLGPVLFLVGLAFALVSCVFLFLFRTSRADGDHVRMGGSALVCLACLMMAFAFIILGPAALTMREQMTEVPNSRPQVER